MNTARFGALVVFFAHMVPPYCDKIYQIWAVTSSFFGLGWCRPSCRRRLRCRILLSERRLCSSFLCAFLPPHTNARHRIDRVAHQSHLLVRLKRRGQGKIAQAWPQIGRTRAVTGNCGTGGKATEKVFHCLCERSYPRLRRNWLLISPRRMPVSRWALLHGNTRTRRDKSSI